MNYKVHLTTNNRQDKQYLSVCYLCISRAIHLIYFTLGRFVAEDPRRCSVDGAVLTHEMINF